MTSKKEVSKTLLKELDAIDKKHESGSYTKKQHDFFSEKAVNKALDKIK